MTICSRKICVVTGTRAEYGLLRSVMQEIRNSEFLELQLIVTGMHLSPEFGLTVNDIEADGFLIDRKVEMLLSSDTSVGITKSMGVALIGFADAFADLKPDLLVIVGDRFEVFSAAAAAMASKLPIAHCHGGELTEGALDEAIRHSITKMSHLHFVSTDEYRKRVIQLGENPDHVYNVGGLGIDSINKLQLLDQNELQNALDFHFYEKNLLITFHPVTLENNTSSLQVNELLDALSELHNTGLIFTMPNADSDSRVIFKKINDFCSQNSNAKAFTSLGQLLYFSCIQIVDGVVGNSSSGLLEVPSFKKGTINIGDRQKGRIRAKSVIDCLPTCTSISLAITQLFSDSFQSQLTKVSNPYGNGGSASIIVNKLEKLDFSCLLQKKFFDL